MSDVELTGRLDSAGCAMALVLAGLGVAEVLVPLTSRSYAGSVALTLASVVGACLPLVVRRRFPFGVVVLQTCSYLALHVVGDLYLLFYGQYVPMAIGLYQAVRHARRPLPAVAVGLIAVVETVTVLSAPEPDKINQLAFQFGVMAVVVVAAGGFRKQAQRVQLNLERAVASEVAVAQEAMAAVLQERTRIARELHDIVGHAVSTMVVLAGAAEQMVDDDPSYVRRTLAEIRSSGQVALTDMRRVVVALRDAESELLEAQPGARHLRLLVDRARAAGLSVTLTVEGASRPLPSGLDLVVYRIVQEALTNVQRHARATSVQVLLAFSETAVIVEVADDGIGLQASTGNGHGLLGMAERVALYGGQLDTDFEAGCRVRAVLPAFP